jgi:hypothetical protein
MTPLIFLFGWLALGLIGALSVITHDTIVDGYFEVTLRNVAWLLIFTFTGPLIWFIMVHYYLQHKGGEVLFTIGRKDK